MTVPARGLRVLASLLMLATACSNLAGQPERSPTAGPTRRGTIAFVRGEATHGTDIWLINADGTGARQLTHGPDIEMRPAWSPDGTELAFVSVPVRPDQEIFHQLLEHDWNIYVIKIDGADETCLTHGTSAAPEHQETPAWSPDGRKILFVSKRRGNFQLYSMNTDGGHQTQITRGRGLFATQPNWQPLP
jgi:TolB protein